MNRREMLQAAGTAVAVTAMSRAVVVGQEPAKTPRHIAMLLYPRFTALDLIGPQQVFAALQGFPVHLVWKTKDPVTSDSGVSILPTRTFQDCPEDLAVLFVPGGTAGTIAQMEDKDTLAFLKSRGGKATYVTSVCTGSLLLGAAGLLRGYKATCHWLVRDLLATFEAEPVEARVVQDRNRITGGGVTAGIDFGLRVAALLRGEPYAKVVQLVMEYDPQPPFQAGSPKQAGAETTEQVRKTFAPFIQSAKAAAERAKQQW